MSVSTSSSVMTSNNSVSYGTSLTFTDNVTALSGATAPTGSVEFFDTTAANLDLGPGVAQPSVGVQATWTLATNVIQVTAGDTIAAVYTPTGGFTTSPGSVVQAVTQATPTISTLPTARGITYGMTLAHSHLSGGVATNPNSLAPVAGNFTFTTPSTMPTAGLQPESITFTPSDTLDYTSPVLDTVNVHVDKATPILAINGNPGTIITGHPFTISATVTGITGPAGPTLESVPVVLTYYIGPGTAAGPNLGSTQPSAPGGYTVVASFAGSTDYKAVTLMQLFVITQVPLGGHLRPSIPGAQTIVPTLPSGAPGLTPNANNPTSPVVINPII